MTLVVLLGIAVARLTRLWRDDAITIGLRERVNTFIENRQDNATITLGFWFWLQDLVECPWCVSVWFSAGAVILVDSATSRSVPLPLVAFGAVAGLAVLVYWLVDLLFEASRYLHSLSKAKGNTPEDEHEERP